MTAPMFFVAPEALRPAEPGSVVPLRGPEGHHAARVRRLRVGESVLLADGEGRRADTVVSAVLEDGLALTVTSLGLFAEPRPRFVLVQALAKAGRDEQAVEAATELGVDEIVPWQAARSVVVWRADRAERGQRKWESVVRAASTQSRRVRTPRVGRVLSTAALAGRLPGAGLALVLHEAAERTLTDVPLPAPRPPSLSSSSDDILVIVGPEGGIGADELALLVGAGGVPVRLGDSVLRSSTAGPAALAVLSARQRWR